MCGETMKVERHEDVSEEETSLLPGRRFGNIDCLCDTSATYMCSLSVGDIDFCRKVPVLETG
jgi:hypothetical protein